MKLYLRREGDAISRATFQTFGCGFSIACCSMLTEMVTGRSVEECRKLTAAELGEALGGLPPEKQFCADLAVEALQDGLRQLSE